MTYADLISYFERIATAHKRLEACYVGDYDKIYDLINDPDQYKLPALWVETPEMTPVGTPDSMQKRWNVSIVILYKGNPQNQDLNKYQIEQSYRTAYSVLTRFLYDVSQYHIRCDIINRTLSPIDPYSADWLIGWRINLLIDTYSDIPCYVEDEWDETIGVNESMEFTVIPTLIGLSITDVSYPSDAGWSFEWLYSFDGATVMTPFDGVEVVDGDAHHTYIVLKATHVNGHVRQASVFHKSGSIITQTSVPYLYTEYNQS